MMRYALLKIIALVVLLLALIIGGNLFFGSAGIDATQDRIFTLDKSTKALIKNQNEKIELDFYFSNHAAIQNPEIAKYAMNVRTILRQFSGVSGGKIVLKEIDVNQFSKEEDAAIAYGLVPFQDSQSSLEPIYFGLIARNGKRGVQIPYFDAKKSFNLEYEIAQSIVKLNANSQKIIGVITGQNWFIESEPSGAPKPIAQIAKSISEENILINLAHDFAILPQRLDVLLIIQPWALSEIQQNLLAQYVASGGKVIVCIDPYSTISADNGIGIKNYAQDLGRLEKEWGIVFSNEVLMDKKGALPVKALINGRAGIMPQPLFFNVPTAAIKNKNAIFDGLSQGINFASPSYLMPANLDGTKFTPLLTSSNDNMRIESKNISHYESPQEAANLWESENNTKTIAALIEKPINGKTAEILVIADTDFLADSLYSDGGIEIADNQIFILNAIDYLHGDASLAHLRTKRPIKRDLERISAMRSAAQNAILESQGALNQELQSQTQQLRELEEFNAKSPMADFENKSLEIKNQILQTRLKLRNLNEGVGKSVDFVKYLIIGICGIIVPFIILLAWFIYRMRRQKLGKIADVKA